MPWQQPRSAYRVWVSEIMLQQTQVATVIPYFTRFMARFPGVNALSAAPLDDVLALWSGLGYYARARNLHRAARVIVEQHGGEFPRDYDDALDLPGVGRSTAGAILSQAFGARHAILDGNVRRVLARHGAVKGWPGAPAVAQKLWALAGARLPKTQLADYSQGFMDLGATLCTARSPRCNECPVAADCRARLANRVAAFPSPRPKRARPSRAAQLLLIENAGGQILLERRAERGIWGGLWCPPLLDTGHPRPRGTRLLGKLPAVRHGFTHFDLTLTPVRLRAGKNAAAAGESRWIARDQLGRYGLPAPVRRILNP